MGIRETSIIYLILGVVVAAALALREERLTAARMAFLALAGVLFWPLLAPSLLGAKGAPAPPPAHAAAAGFEPKIQAAEERLLLAIAKVKGGVAEGALGPEVARVKGLGGSLRAMAQRLDEIDEMLRAPEFDRARLTATLADLRARAPGDDDPRVTSLGTRLRNVERLAAMRAKASEDLESALLKVEEITSQVLLLKFAGRPESEVARMVNEIADGVEGVAEALMAVA